MRVRLRRESGWWDTACWKTVEVSPVLEHDVPALEDATDVAAVTRPPRHYVRGCPPYKRMIPRSTAQGQRRFNSRRERRSPLSPAASPVGRVPSRGRTGPEGS